MLVNNRGSISILPAEEGWALKENKTRSRFSEKQKSLTDKFNIGQRSGRKVSPESVARDMRRANGPDGGRLFDISDFLKPEQISSFFSRLAAKVRQSVPDDLDVNAIEEEDNFSSARAAVMSSIHLEHPITYDSYDLCSLVKNSKLRSLKVPMLQIICQALELDVPVPAKKLKKPYVELIKNVVYNCGC